MPEFVSPFWNWFIIVTVVLSIVALLVLIKTCSGGEKPAPGEAKPMGHVWDGTLEELNNPMPDWWLKLFYITIFFGIGYLALYPGLGTFPGLLGWTQVKQYNTEMAKADEKYGPLFKQYLHQDVVTVAADPEAKLVGKRLFATYCTSCHGSDARGARGFPNLTDVNWLYGGEPEKIEESIKQGRNGVMPAWGELLGNEAVFNVALYVQGLSGREVDEVAMAKGKEIFATNCAACHGADGKGNQMLGAPNLTDDIWLHGGSSKRITESIMLGRQSQMPAHGEFLGDAKVHLLAAYIYSLSTDK